jgi:hypothetical protein
LNLRGELEDSAVLGVNIVDPDDSDMIAGPVQVV